jgi:class 3 adenylate cyclase/tetratricopeptide (TPR) repeat protein
MVTVLFCDLVGSTELSGVLDAEPLRELMLRYFGRMRGCVERHGGVVEKYIGDAVMAVFGVPVVREDDALRAVRAAAQMRDALCELNADVSTGFDVTLTVRIGVNTGQVVAAADPDAAQALVAGETVNMAARLEQYAQPGEILLGPLTCQLLEGVVSYEPTGAITPKGFRRPVTPGRLISIGMATPAIPRRLDLALVDRDSELAILRDAFAIAVAKRTCRVVALRGEAGIGKSRLAAEFAAGTRAAGALVLEGACSGYGAGGSLTALAQAIRQLLARWDPPAMPGSDLTEALTMVHTRLLADESPGLEPGETFWVVCRILEAAGRERPLVMILDDLHWADAALLDMVSSLAAGVSGVPLTLLCLGRPGFGSGEGDWGDHLSASTCQLVPPLPEEDCLRLIAELDEVVAHDADLARRAVSRAEGNPLYLEQLVRVVAVDSEQVIPAGVSGLIACRLDLLNAPERRIIGLASIVGRVFTPAELIAATADDISGRLPDLLFALIGRGLISPAGDGIYQFDSALVREVAYESMPKGWRAAAHERIAAWLSDGGTDGEAVGTHWERAWVLRGELGTSEADRRPLASKAADALHAAGSLALAGCDAQRAVRLLDRALALCAGTDPQVPRLLLRAGEAKVMTGDAAAGQRLLSQAGDSAHAAQDACVQAHAELQLAYLSDREQFTAMLHAAQRTLPVFERSGDCLGISRALLWIGVAEQSQGRHATAARAFGRALDQAARLDAELEQAIVLGALAESLCEGPLRADAAISRCQSLLRDYGTGRRAVRAALFCPLAVLAGMTGEHDQAARYLDEAAQIVAGLGNVRATVLLPIFAAATATLAGNLGEAYEKLTLAWTISLTTGDPQLTEAATRDLARVELLRGHDNEAATLAAAPVLDDMPAAIADRCGVMARVLARRGHGEQAREQSAFALAAARRTDSPVSRATACLDAASTLADLGEIAAARKMVRRSLTWFQRKAHLVGVGWAGQLLEEMA